MIFNETRWYSMLKDLMRLDKMTSVGISWDQMQLYLNGSAKILSDNTEMDQMRSYKIKL